MCDVVQSIRAAQMERRNGMQKLFNGRVSHYDFRCGALPPNVLSSTGSFVPEDETGSLCFHIPNKHPMDLTFVLPPKEPQGEDAVVQFTFVADIHLNHSPVPDHDIPEHERPKPVVNRPILSTPGPLQRPYIMPSGRLAVPEHPCYKTSVPEIGGSLPKGRWFRLEYVARKTQRYIFQGIKIDGKWSVAFADNGNVPPHLKWVPSTLYSPLFSFFCAYPFADLTPVPSIKSGAQDPILTMGIASVAKSKHTPSPGFSIRQAWFVHNLAEDTLIPCWMPDLKSEFALMKADPFSLPRSKQAVSLKEDAATATSTTIRSTSTAAAVDDAAAAAATVTSYKTPLESKSPIDNHVNAADAEAAAAAVTPPPLSEDLLTTLQSADKNNVMDTSLNMLQVPVINRDITTFMHEEDWPSVRAACLPGVFPTTPLAHALRIALLHVASLRPNVTEIFHASGGGGDGSGAGRKEGDADYEDDDDDDDDADEYQHRNRGDSGGGKDGDEKKHKVSSSSTSTSSTGGDKKENKDKKDKKDKADKSNKHAKNDKASASVGDSDRFNDGEDWSTVWRAEKEWADSSTSTSSSSSSSSSASSSKKAMSGLEKYKMKLEKEKRDALRKRLRKKQQKMTLFNRRGVESMLHMWSLAILAGTNMTCSSVATITPEALAVIKSIVPARVYAMLGALVNNASTMWAKFSTIAEYNVVISKQKVCNDDKLPVHMCPWLTVPMPAPLSIRIELTHTRVLYEAMDRLMDELRGKHRNLLTDYADSMQALAIMKANLTKAAEKEEAAGQALHMKYATSLYRALLEIVIADHHVTADELRLLGLMRQRFGLSYDDHKRVVDSLDINDDKVCYNGITWFNGRFIEFFCVVYWFSSLFS